MAQNFPIFPQTTLMKKIFTLFFLIAAMGNSAQAQDFDYKIPVKNVNALVKVLGDDLVILESESDANRRYVARNLPEEYKKNDLKVTFSGLEAPIPPNFRMAGRPLHLLCIKINAEDQKKFNLSKTKYTFKKPK